MLCDVDYITVSMLSIIQSKPESSSNCVFEMNNLIVHSLNFFAVAVNGLPQQTPPIDTADPNSADPTTVPESDFALSEPRTAEPFVNGIPTLPDVCISSNLTEDCFRALDNDEQGAYLWLENGHGMLMSSFGYCWVTNTDDCEGCTPEQEDKLKRGEPNVLSEASSPQLTFEQGGGMLKIC